MNKPVSKKFEMLGRKGRPVRAIFEITYRCNAHCEYCYLGRLRDTTPDLDTARVFDILDKLSASGVLFLTLTGGEPFLREDILSILDRCRTNGFFSTSIMTNGILLTKEHIDYLIANHKILSCTLSMTVFSCDPAVNDSYFGVPGALDTIVRNATILKQHGVEVMFKIPVFKETVENLPETIMFFKSKGFPVIHSGSKSITDENKEILKNSITVDFFKEYFSKSRVAEPPVKDNVSSTKPDHGLCVNRFTEIAIGPQGDLLPCLIMRPKYSDANIFDFPDVSSAIISSAMCSKARSLTINSFTKCLYCSDADACLICVAENYNDFQDFSQPSPKRCNYMHVRKLETEKK